MASNENDTSGSRVVYQKVDDHSIPIIIEGLEKTFRTKSNRQFANQARLYTENICKYVLVAEGQMKTMKERFQIGDVYKNSWYAVLVDRSQSLITSIEIIRQVGNKASHTMDKMTNEEVLISRKSLAQITRYFIPKINDSGLTKKLDKQTKDVFNTSIKANRRYSEKSYLQALNLLEENLPEFGEALHQWLNNVLIARVRDEEGKVPYRLYYDPKKEIIDIPKALNYVDNSKVKSSIETLFNFYLRSCKGKSDYQEPEPVPGQIKDAFYSLANELYAIKPDEIIKGKTSPPLTVAILTLTCMMGLFVWQNPALKNFLFNGENAGWMMGLSMGFSVFFLINIYELVYGFQGVHDKKLRNFSSILTMVAGLVVVVLVAILLFKVVQNGGSIGSYINLLSISTIWFLVIGLFGLRISKPENGIQLRTIRIPSIVLAGLGVISLIAIFFLL